MMRVERPWGSYEVLAKNGRWQIKRLIVNPGHRLSLQYHKYRNEYWVVIKGDGILDYQHMSQALKPGGMHRINSRQMHRADNMQGSRPLEILEIQFGARLDEQDIVRVEDDYGRVSKSDES